MDVRFSSGCAERRKKDWQRSGTIVGTGGANPLAEPLTLIRIPFLARMSSNRSEPKSHWRNLCPKIILEGTRMTYKTEIAFGLNEHPRFVGPRKYRYHSPIISAEWGGFLNAPWGECLITFSPERETLALETYELWLKLFEHQPYLSYIIDRFHLSTQVYQWLYRHRKYDFTELEERLYRLGFRLVFCHRDPDTFVEARRERLKVSGNPSQYDELTMIMREQELLASYAEKSILPKFYVDITDGDLPSKMEAIVGWYEATGGLALDGDRVRPVVDEKMPSVVESAA
jgi:hypothetical protein